LLTYAIRSELSVVNVGTPTRKQSKKQVRETSLPPISYSKEAVFKRKMDRCLFKVGDEVLFRKPRRSAPRGTIINIETDFTQVHWDKNVPQYILVDCGNKGVISTHESKLRKKV